MIAGKPIRSDLRFGVATCCVVAAIAATQTDAPHRLLEGSRSSRFMIASALAPINFTPYFSRTPRFGRSMARFKRGLAAHRRQQRIGPLLR